MNTPNPLLPQGSLQGQSKGKSNFRIAVFTILAIHVVLICGFLIQGCKPTPKPEPTPDETTTMPTNDIPPFNSADANPFPTDTNAQPDYGQPTNGGTVPPPAFGNTGAVVNSGITSAAPNGANSFTSAPAVPGGNTSAPTGFNVDTTAPVSTGETTTHSVAKGEMLSTIARKYHVTVRAIEEANPGLNPVRLQIGQKLNIPAAAATAVPSNTSIAAPVAATGTESYTIYTVKSGDVLERIARNNNTTVSAIKAANGMKLDRINVGQKLKIPKKGQ